jgi:hypothetical protein
MHPPEVFRATTLRVAARQMKVQDRAALDDLARDMRLEALLADVRAEPDEISG